MYRWLFFFIIAAIILFLLFLPDILPKCSCCKKFKLRPFMRIHRAISINPGYGGSRSVCIKCCRQYNITNIQELDKLMDVRRRLRLESLSKGL
jgi:hypothetical protein